jgi:hypothetical protein
MTSCKCGSDTKHNVYLARNHDDKNTKFNDIIVNEVVEYQSRNSHRILQYHVIDDGSLATSRALIASGVDPISMTAFTHCMNDFRNMKNADINVGKRCIDAKKLYSERIFSRGNHIVIDDGMQTARNTLPRARILLKSGFMTLAIVFNIVPRCKKLSHIKFVHNIRSFATKYGYKVECKKLIPYSQGDRGQIMWPYWFEFEKKQVCT